MSRIFSLYNNKIFLLPFFDRDLLLNRGSTSDFIVYPQGGALLYYCNYTLIAVLHLKSIFSFVKMTQKYDLIFSF